jgi:general nucleoside transport system ATP-binding protein
LAELVAEGITKRYGALTALDAVSVSFVSGEIHAVVGENGAGKSTFVGVLSGFVRPDSGRVALNSRDLPLGSAFSVKRLGVEMIHQHFTLVPALTVRENLALGRVTSLFRLLRPETLVAKAVEVAQRLGWSIDLDARVGDLPVGTQQRVEILKALGGDAEVLIFDEPTAVLAPEEVDELFAVLRKLRDDGKMVILIAHKLSEILSVADRVTVLRRGKKVASALISETNADEIAGWIVGDLEYRSNLGVNLTAAQGEGLSVRGLNVLGDRGNVAIDEISFEIARGEVLGFGGVDGNGQVELAEALAGVRPFTGAVEFRDVPDAAEVGYVPQDRQADGLALRMSIRDNLLITGHRDASLTTRGWLKSGAIESWSSALIQRFGIKARGPAQVVGGLSGGNQQKVVVSRALEKRRDLLVFVNPTRGLDLAATQFVHGQIREAQTAGTAVALITTDRDELFALSNRTVFLSKGKLTESLIGGSA